MPTRSASALARVILYARSAHAGNDDAVKEQLAACRAWSEAHGGSVADAYHEYSSANGPCPELQRAIQAAQALGAALVCLRQDRLARSMTLAFERLMDCRRRGVPVFFTDLDQPEEATQRTAAILAGYAPASRARSKAAPRQPKPAAVGKKRPARAAD